VREDLRRGLALWVAFAAIAWAIYTPALEGPPISDDVVYLESPFVRQLDRERIGAILDPWGQAKYFASGNYAPVHLLAHAVEIHLFGADVRPYHAVNVLLHATNAVLLAALLASTGVPAAVAALGGGVFLVHPANVEAVAWISQLKSVLALALCLLALLALRRRPGFASALFVLALLTKAHAVFALPMAAVLLYVRWGEGGYRRRHALWLAGWAAAFALFAPFQVDTFAQTTAAFRTSAPAAAEALRSALANVGRYFVMAATGYGVAAFHEPPPTRGWLDPWLLVALALAIPLAARAAWALRTRSLEAAFWVGALAAWVPVSQLYSFVSPLGDRYLYFMLPGLIGGVAHACAGPGRSARLAAPPLRVAAALGVAACLVWFSLHAHRRAFLWTDTNRLLIDSAGQYPDGSVAAYVAARRAAATGDAAGAVAALRRSAAIEPSRTQMVFLDPYFAGLRDDPAFQTFVREVAQRYLEAGRAHQLGSQAWLQIEATLATQLGDWSAAEDAIERAIRLGGPLRPQLLFELDELRAARRAARGAAAPGPDPGTAPVP
jgi:hypothetical protein